jgi:hypothetical protein
LKLHAVLRRPTVCAGLKILPDKTVKTKTEFLLPTIKPADRHITHHRQHQKLKANLVITHIIAARDSKSMIHDSTETLRIFQFFLRLFESRMGLG